MRIHDDGTISLTIGFSPCPNDTFIFDALVNGRIPTGKLRFEPVIDDVEALNRLALASALDITKVSVRAFHDCSVDYQLLNAGSALGFGVGPLLIKRPETEKIQRVAIPGVNTTASFLFSLFHPEVTDRREYLFSEIEDAVLSGEVDAGVIIHENRFTYAERGLEKVVDLGNSWEERYARPIPLGGIAIQRALDEGVRRQVDRLVAQSLQHAWNNPSDAAAFIELHAQEMDPEVRRNHIGLYVNDYSLNLGETGRSAIRFFLESVRQLDAGRAVPMEPLFVPNASEVHA